MGNGNKIALITTITLVIVALLLANNVSAKQLIISENDIKQIKSVLDLSGVISEVIISDAKLKTILNLAIRGGDTGIDITYGLLVLTSLNEMDFIDMVVSQRYKSEADAYFNSVLDRRLNIAGYYKGTAFDVFRVLSNRVPSPMAALTLNSFDITDKAIEIFTAFNNLKLIKFYDGLWYYFDTRKNGNESHEVAWSDARDAMGFAAKPSSFLKTNTREDGNVQIGFQFATLYEKWGPYIEINKGVKKEFKEQVKSELQNTLALAAEEQALAEKEKENKLSFLEKMKLTLANLMKEAERAMAKIQEIIGLGGAQVSQMVENTEQTTEDEPDETAQMEIVEPEAKLTADEIQEILDDIAEKIDIISQEIAELTGQTAEASALDIKQPQKEQEILELKEIKEEEIILVTEDQQAPPVVFHYGTPSALVPEEIFKKILISEVQISPSGERFVELYNPNNETINLSDWYIQRKTKTGTSWSSFISSTHFEGKTIGAFSHFLVASSTGADIILGLTLTEGNSLILKSPNREIVDKVGWGEAQEFETASTSNPQAGKSIGRKWSTTTQNYIDTDNNQNDFEIQIPTPGSQNQTPALEPESELEPEPEPEPELEMPSLSVVINEIVWMGTSATNSSDEWIELYNNATSTIDLTGWILGWSHGTTTHSLTFSTSSITANSFYLLERTASDTTDIVEDQIYTGALSNNGEKMELRDAGNNLIDFFDFSSSWPAGSSTPYYISMERINSTSSATSTNWANNNLLTRNGRDALGNKINGTPRTQNSVSVSSTTIFNLPLDEFSEITLIKPGSPYMIQQNLTVPIGKTLKIGPGAVLKFNDSTEIEVRGNLKAIGNEAEKIIFERNSTGIPGNDRYRLYFIESQNSIIDNANFIDGGRLTYVPFDNPGGLISGVIETENSNISIKNSSIVGAFPRGINSSGTTTIENTIVEGTRNSDWFPNTFALLIRGDSSSVASSTFENNTIGIKITGGSPRIENNIFQENGTPIFLEGGDSHPIFLNNSAQNNGTNGIVVDSANIIADTIWQSNLPYVVGSKYIEAGITLTLKQGTIVKMGGSFIVLGKIITEGTLLNPVVFTSGADDEYGGDTNNNDTSTLPAKGDWRQLKFDSSATSTLEGVRIRYGSGYCDGANCLGAVNLVSRAVEIKDSVIEKNIWGIFTDAGHCEDVFETLKLTNVDFFDNDRDIALPYGVDCVAP